MDTRDDEGFFVLERNYSDLYKKVRYLTDLSVVINRITEYDIKSANTSMLRRAGKLPASQLDEIDRLPKDRREVLIGNMIRADSSIYKTIAKGIIRSKQELFEANNIQDDEVLTIKNDAVFIIGRKLKYTEFGPVLFRPKHVYSVFLNVDGIELYYDKQHDEVTVLGVSDDVLETPDHQVGMLRFFCDVMKYLALDNRDKLRKFLIEFVNEYKRKELPVQYYRELNGFNIYRTIYEIAGYNYNLTQAGDGDRELINGIYNYTRFILPIVQAFI